MAFEFVAGGDASSARDQDTASAALIAMTRSPRMEETDSDACRGTVRWAPKKSLFAGAMTLGALIGAPLFFSWSAVLLFLATTAITICFGHSIGMHRRLIHQSFACPLWLERIFVYLGTLVGMAGPSGMIRQHDIRDWAQRKPDCHPFLSHRNPIWKDYWYQVHSELALERPPELVIEPRVRADRFYRFLDRFDMAQQIPWAILFFAIGGLPWVFWGICLRVSLSITGHWLVGYFAHNRGPRNWHVSGAGVQGYNVPYVSVLTMGESLHNNHHAFPGSARLAHEHGEVDPGWYALRTLEKLGLVWGLHTPETLPARPALKRLA